MSLINKLLNKSKPQEPVPTISPDAPKTYTRRIKVAGVTFNNDDGTSRQEILQKIKEKKAPFNKQLNVSVESTEYNGEFAMKVFVNSHLVGWVPKDMLGFIKENKDRITGISDFYVSGDATEGFRANFKIQVIPKG